VRPRKAAQYKLPLGRGNAPHWLLLERDHNTNGKGKREREIGALDIQSGDYPERRLSITQAPPRGHTSERISGKREK